MDTQNETAETEKVVDNQESTDLGLSDPHGFLDFESPF